MDLGVLGFYIALIALLLSAVATWIQWRDHRDKHASSFVLVGSMSRTTDETGYRVFSMQLWRLFNAGQVTVVDPQITVDGDEQWPTMHFKGSGILPANSELRVVPIGDYPNPDFEGGAYWDRRQATVEWTSARGKTRSAPARVSYSYV
jgi:hypothetical protein